MCLGNGSSLRNRELGTMIGQSPIHIGHCFRTHLTASLVRPTQFLYLYFFGIIRIPKFKGPTMHINIQSYSFLSFFTPFSFTRRHDFCCVAPPLWSSRGNGLPSVPFVFFLPAAKPGRSMGHCYDLGRGSGRNLHPGKLF